MNAAPRTNLFGSLVRSRTTARCRADEHEYPAGTIAQPHVHEHTYLSIVVAGRVLERFGGRSEEMTESHVQLMPAGERHSNEYRAATRCIHFDVDAVVTDVASAGGVVAPGARRDARTAVLGRLLIDELRRDDAASSLAVDGLLYALLARSAAEPSGTAPRWLDRVLEALRDNLSDGVSLHDLGRVAGVHPAHLTREFHRRTGRTIGAYLRELRVARACELLSRTDDPLGDIALACGFCDQSHFTATFRRATGVTPAIYRQRLR